MKSRWFRFAAALALSAGGLSVPALARQDQPAAPETAKAPEQAKAAPYQRIVEEDDGAVVKLEMAVREFAPPKPGQPRIFMAAAVHIGERDFYSGLQQFLDAQDVVLFEGVKPPGAGSVEHDEGEKGDTAKAAATKRRVRFIAMAVKHYEVEHGELPESFEQLVSGSETRMATLLKDSFLDAWGRGLVYTVDASAKAGFEVVSLGSDGEPGGEAAAADLKLSDQKPLTKGEIGEKGDGIQAKLAKAMGLVFQLDAMDHNKPNWRNSDLSIDQVQARLDKSGESGDALFKMLDGSSFMGKLAGMLLGMMSATPEMRAMLRVMMIETIGRADEMFEQLPGNMGDFMEVILHDRNAVVLEDLKKVIADEPKVKSIGIIYGGGHLPGLEKGLAEMGYTAVGDSWRAAMRVEAKEAGVTPAQLKAQRRMMSRMLDQQLKAAKKKPKK